MSASIQYFFARIFQRCFFKSTFVRYFLDKLFNKIFLRRQIFSYTFWYLIRMLFSWQANGYSHFTQAKFLWFLTAFSLYIFGEHIFTIFFESINFTSFEQHFFDEFSTSVSKKPVCKNNFLELLRTTDLSNIFL